MSMDKKSQLAVALHYDRTGAPRVVAKGKGSLGAKIIEAVDYGWSGVKPVWTGAELRLLHSEF